MVLKYQILCEFLGFEPEKNETVVIDGNYWIIDSFIGDQVNLEQCRPLMVGE